MTPSREPEKRLLRCKLNSIKPLLMLTPRERLSKKLSNNKIQTIPLLNSRDL